ASPKTTLLAVPSRRAWWIAAAAVLGVIAGGAAVALLVQSRTRTVPQVVRRVELTTSQADKFTTEPPGANVAISPDGSRIIYTATREGVPELVVRRIDRLEASPIAGTEGGGDPFFLPDGRRAQEDPGGRRTGCHDLPGGYRFPRRQLGPERCDRLRGCRIGLASRS